MSGRMNANGDISMVSAWLTAFGDERTQAQVTMVELSPLARFGPGAAGLAGLWGAAAAAVFFPVVHLILVPTLLVGGVVLPCA
jgi:hypothetical protein